MGQPGAINRFKGMAPRLSDWQAGWEWADLALDVDVSRGTLKPFRTPKVVAGATSADHDFYVNSLRCSVQTLARCMAIADPLPGGCNPVYGTGIPGKALARSYDGGATWTGAGYDLGAFLLTLPLVASGYAVARTDDGYWQATGVECQTQRAEYLAFACTLVGNDPNEESSLGAVLRVDLVDPVASPNITIGNLPTAVPAGYPVPVSVNVYMARTPIEQGGEGTNKFSAGWTLAGTVPFSTPSITLSLQVPAGPAIIFPRADAPPAGLTDLVAHRDGTMSARTDTFVTFSAKLRPHAWPAEQRIQAFDRIRKWVAGQSFGYILTDDQPIVVGVAMLDDMHRKVKIVEDSLPITWPSSAAVWHSSVIYASRDGLVMLQPDGAYRLISAAHWTPAQWRALNAQQIQAVAWDGYYWGFGPKISFRIRIPEAAYGDADPELIYLSAHPKAVQLENDHLYLLFTDGIYKWNEGDSLQPYVWRSRGTNKLIREYMDAYGVDADGPVDVTHFADGRQVAKHLGVSGVRRFPIGTEPRIYAFEIAGTGEVELYRVADDVHLLAA